MEQNQILRLWSRIEAEEGKLLSILKELEGDLYDACEDIYRRFYKLPMDASLPKQEVERIHRDIGVWRRQGLERSYALKLYMRDLERRSRIKTREALFLCLFAAFVSYYQALGVRIEKPLAKIAQIAYRDIEAQVLTGDGESHPPISVTVLLEQAQPDGDSFWGASYQDAQYRAKGCAQQVRSGATWDKLKEELREALEKQRRWVLREAPKAGRKLNRYTGYLDRTVGYVVGYTTVQGMVDAGVKSYRFIAVLDERTTEECQALHGRVFDIKDLKLGVNAPPIYPPPHPCRSMIRPVAQPAEKQEKEM